MASAEQQTARPAGTPGEVRFETLPYDECVGEVMAFRNAQRETRRDQRYFDWRYAGKPVVGKAYVTFGRNRTGNVIAAASAIPHDFHVVDRMACVAVTGDIAVAPEFRGRGVARELLAQLRCAALERGSIGCFVLPNAEATGSLLKAGWQQVSSISRYVRLLCVKRQARRRFGIPGLLMGSVVDALIRAGTGARTRRVANGLSLSRSSSPGEGYDDLWARLPKSGRVLAVRNRAYLQWRFIEKPGAAYQILEARRSGQLVGYVVYSLTGEIAQIDDFAVLDAAAAAALREHLVDVVRADRCADSIQARFVSDTLLEVPWRSRDFVRRADTQLVLWAAAPEAPAAPPSAGWFVTPADKDV